MDEALGLAVGLGRVRLGPDVFETELLTGFGKSPGSIAGAVVGHDALDCQAQARIVGDRRLEERHGALLAFILHDLAEGNARGIVDANVDELPPRLTRAVLFGADTCDAVTHAIEFAELFDVDVDQLAGMLTLISAHSFSRL
ncbi:hypothetical protein ACVWXO_004646 [Bradyrhizobium sp. LM2.7]